VDEESLDSGHTPGIDLKGVNPRLPRDRFDWVAEVSMGEEPRNRPGLVSRGGKVRKKVPHLHLWVMVARVI
jgi:hypothetical protein